MRILLILLFITSLARGFAQPAPDSPELLKYVDPFIGTAAHGHTFPGATAPFGMVQLSPDTRLEGWDGCSGYHYSDSLIYGFSHTHLSGTGVPDYGDILFQPYMRRAMLNPEAYKAPFKKSDEHAEPGYYSVIIDSETDAISVELTATERVGVHRIIYPENREIGHLLIDLRHRDQVLSSSMTVINDYELVGFRNSSAWAKDQRVYFAIRFSRPFFNSKVIDMTQSPRISQRTVTSKGIVGLLDFYCYEGMPIVAAVGISAVSVQNARENLEKECGHLDFDRVRAETQAKWARQLSKIEVEGGTDDQKTTFYTALYHTMIAPNLYSDVNGQYRGRDMEVHNNPGHEVYTVFSLWDTYRACNPLFTLLEPDRTNAFIQTFLRQYEQGGLLPIWELSACETDCMIGNHAIPVITDAWMKGIRGYNGNLALEAMRTSANQDRYGLRWYKQLGYIPSDEEPESVSKTLEYAYDDWCIALMAGNLGKKDIADTFLRRAQYYKNVFDPSTGFFRAKNNATWHTPFDPYEVNFNYTEANAWQYRFAAPQDVSGMMKLLGGREGFVAALDSLFTTSSTVTGRNQADITGLIGQYVQGNEPSHHMAYLYAFAGQPWKTQQRVRQILDEQYSSRPDGLSGNEDCGQMSAWYVFSALGFYPAVPGRNQYVIGTPLFEKATIHLDNGKSFTISAKGASARRPYVRQAYLNGQAWENSWISHLDVRYGGELRLDMTDKPAAWGKDSVHCPISAIGSTPIVPIPFIDGANRVFQDSQQIRIGCADPDARLFYSIANQTDSSGVAYRPYTAPLTIRKSMLLYFYAEYNGQRSPVEEAEFFALRPDMRVLRYSHPYSPQYTGGGEQALVDLQPGGADFRSGRWQGYEGVDLEVVLDRGDSKPLHTVRVNFLQDENAWIFFPTQLQVMVSDDGVTFAPAGTVVNDIPPTATGSLQQTLTLELSDTSARYIKVTAGNLGVCPEGHKGAGNPCWLFVDEIYVE
ncbi:MAG: glycoside hydrolase family 92 protein [Bacteroidetes bacterium]|nr:MAG: glycoside hydrolase family 92 protein [Bacteroidota bacterium]